MDINLQKLNDRIKVLSIKTDKFKSSKIEINFLMPFIEGETAALSLLPFYLSRTTAKYSTPELLCAKLADLYGAVVSASVAKRGDSLEQSIRISSISDRLAFENEKIFEEMFRLLYEIIFSPNANNQEFDSEYLENEKRLARERIESEINDKRKYALQKAIETMCEGEPFGNSKYGSLEELERVNGKSIFDAYKKTLSCAQINITVVSDSETDFSNPLFEALSALETGALVKTDNILKPARKSIIKRSEILDVNQGKLVIGFRNGTKKSVKDSVKSKIMADIFGGGPYSLLFENVREKESLCYYCATVYDRSKELMIVDSGVEFDNLEKTQSEILKYFKKVQTGDFDASVYEASKKGMSEAYAAVPDSIDTLCSWYSSQLYEDEIISPAEYIGFINDVTVEDVVSSAKDFEADTVFCIIKK